MNWRKPIIFALLKITGSKIPSILKEIEQIDNSSKKEIEDYQKDKLEKILLHAWKNVPYYSKVLTKARVVVDGKVNLENFDKIPVLTKDIIRKEGKNLYSKDYKKRKFYENTSGGSTGEPVRFIQDKEYDEWNNSTKIYYKLLNKQDIGEKELRFWGSERDLLEGKEKRSIRFRNWLYNRKEFNAFKMSEKDMFDFVEKWNNFNPSWIEAYVQSIYEFAKFVKKNNLKVITPKNGILTSAGTLYLDMKKTIEETFNCKVYNRYGSREVGGIACSNKNFNKLKISFWHNYLEILNKKNKTFGKVILTPLNNYSMPLIRYDIGDIAVKGKNTLNLNKIKGRDVGLIKTTDGKLIDGEFFTHLFYYKYWVEKFQVIQKSVNRIQISIVGKKNVFDMKNIELDIKKVMGKECVIKWRFVKEILSKENGKYEFVRREIK
ncbi:MAG: phenylacetate--CoA ligase family protein [archaeon]